MDFRGYILYSGDYVVEWRRWRLTEARAFAYQKVLCSVALCYLDLIWLELLMTLNGSEEVELE